MKHVLLGIITLLAFVSGGLLVKSLLERRTHDKNRRAALEAGGAGAGTLSSQFSCEGVAAKILAYMLKLEARIAHKSTKCFSKKFFSLDGGGGLAEQGAAGGSVGGAGAAAGVAGAGAKSKLDVNILQAGLSGKVSKSTITEARLRLGGVAALFGAVVGACLSNELMFILGAFALVAGAVSPTWAISQEVKARSDQLKIELPEMLEVVSLGMSSGLSFDRSFGLYYAYFDTSFSKACANAHKRWTMGFSTREEALNDLSAQYDSNMLHRVVQNIERSMKFGTSLSDDLKRAADDSRAEQKAATQERVAKVPVRMMIPTACLILPAMLILVLGPVLLELIGGFSV